MKGFRFRVEATGVSHYLCDRIDPLALRAMENDQSFYVDATFTVQRDAETCTILIEADEPGFTPTPISGCPWRMNPSYSY